MNNFELTINSVLIENFLSGLKEKESYFEKLKGRIFWIENTMFLTVAFPFTFIPSIWVFLKKNYFFFVLDKVWLSLIVWFCFLILVFIFIKNIIKFEKSLAKQKDIIETELINILNPFETAVLYSYRAYKELDSYARYKIPSDFGLGGDIEIIINNYLKPLRGQRHYFPSNSFFKDMENVSQVKNKLKEYGFYDLLGQDKDIICAKILELKENLGGFIDRDTKLGAKLFYKVSEVFVYLIQKEIQKFKEALEELLCGIIAHRKTKTTPVGIFLLGFYIIRFIKKIWMPFLGLCICIIGAIFLFMVFSRWISIFCCKRGIYIKKEEIDLIIMGAIGLMYFIPIKKNQK